jgi:hypothetical protein
MPTTACAIPRLKDFKYRVEINGLEAAAVQEFEPGTRTHGVTVHSGAGQNHVCKEVGMIGFSNAVLRSVVPVDGPGRIYWEDWMDQAQDPATGNGGMPAQYQRNFSVFELAPNGSPSRVWEYIKGFPVSFKVNAKSSLDDSTDVLEFVEIAYNRREVRVL